MDDIRSWWEVPCIAHFCHIFAKPFKLVDFDIEELEDTLLLDEVKDGSTPSLLVNLYCGLLNGIVDKEVNEENWEFFLKMHLQWRVDHLGEEWNPHKDKIYKDLDTRTKVEILHKMIHWRMELDDIGDLLRGIDGPTLRIQSIGKDESGNVYWYFYGTRLYLETPKKKPPRKTKQDQSTGPKGKKGRGSKSNKVSTPPPQADGEEEGGVWKMVCSTVEEWEELVEDLSNTKRGEGRKLYNYINNELLPDVLHSLHQKEKMFKKKLLAEMPRRTSDRLAQKAEEEIYEALAREKQREENRLLEAEERAQKEAEAEKKHREKMEEVIKRRKAKEEEQIKQRQEEEKNWSLAMSGELSGPRQAAIGAVQGVVETQHLIEDSYKDEVLYTAMYKVLSGLRRHEDGWVFEEPVSEDIAPGYFDVVDTPMDYQTVEKKIESHQYTTKEEFVGDIELIFANCKAYNGEDSEYYALAGEMDELLKKLLTEQFVDEMLNKVEEEEEGKRGKKKNSPSPELTSESSEESEEESEVDEDEDETIDNIKKKKRSKSKVAPPMPHPQLMGMRPQVPGMSRGMFPPPHMMRPMMSPEMMGYPPQYPYPPYMHMRPPTRDMYYPPPDYPPRYPYPMNGAPPPYRQHMYPPDYPMPPMARGPHPMGGAIPPNQLHNPRGGAPVPPTQIPNGPPMEQVPPTSAPPTNIPKRVSSPRVSSTVQTPPTSGDEHDDGRSQEEENVPPKEAPPKPKEDESKELKENEDKSVRGGDTPSNPPPPGSGYPYQPHPSMYPNWPHPQMRGEYPPPPHLMNERYYQSMRHRMPHGGNYPPPGGNYPPPPMGDHPSMWNGHPPYPGMGGAGYSPQQMMMMERQRRAYYEYQMRLRMRGPQTPPTQSRATPPSTASPSNKTKDHDAPPVTTPSAPPTNTESAETDKVNNNEEQTSLAKGDSEDTKATDSKDDDKDEGMKQQDSMTKDEVNHKEEARNKDEVNHKGEVNHKAEVNHKGDNASKEPTKPKHYPPHPSSHPSWPHPSQYHPMMSNGYAPHMPQPQSPYHHMYPRGHAPPHHPSNQMQYPPHHYPDPSFYGHGGRGYSPAEMERWQYMEMMQRHHRHQQQQQQQHQQQQWLMSQQQRSGSGTPPVKRSRPEEEGTPPLKDVNTDHTQKIDSNHTQPPASTEAPPPSKLAKMAPVAEGEGGQEVNGVAGEEDDGERAV